MNIYIKIMKRLIFFTIPHLVFFTISLYGQSVNTYKFKDQAEKQQTVAMLDNKISEVQNFIAKYGNLGNAKSKLAELKQLRGLAAGQQVQGGSPLGSNGSSPFDPTTINDMLRDLNGAQDKAKQNDADLNNLAAPGQAVLQNQAQQALGAFNNDVAQSDKSQNRRSGEPTSNSQVKGQPDTADSGQQLTNYDRDMIMDAIRSNSLWQNATPEEKAKMEKAVLDQLTADNSKNKKSEPEEPQVEMVGALYGDFSYGVYVYQDGVRIDWTGKNGAMWMKPKGWAPPGVPFPAIPQYLNSLLSSAKGARTEGPFFSPLSEVKADLARFGYTYEK